MVGRNDWRKSTAFILALATCAVLLFAGAASESRADFLERVRDTVSDGIRTLTGRPDRTASRPAIIKARSSRAETREYLQKRRDLELLILRGYEIRPVADDVVPKTLPELVVQRPTLTPDSARGTDAADTDYYLAQYDGRAQAYRKLIEEEGVQILGWVPNAAYLVRGLPHEIEGVRSLAETQWVGEWLPAYKVTPEVVAMAETGDTTTMPLDDLGRVRLMVDLHDGTDAKGNAALLEALPGVSIRGIGLEDPAVALDVDPTALRETVVELAFLRDVFAVEPDPLPVPNNDHSVWYLQTGNDSINTTNYDVSARLFALGLTGRGLIGAVADSGLEIDLCYFRYGAAINETAWVMGPDDGTAIPDEGGDLPADLTVTPPARTRSRKVVAYYLMDGASPGDESPHGTQTASCMVGDNFQVLAARPLLRDLGIRQNIINWRLDGEWPPAIALRDDIQARVDDPTASEPTFATTFGRSVQHHEARDGAAPGAQLVFQDIGGPTGLTGSYQGTSLLAQAHNTGATAHNTSFGGGPCNPASCYGGLAQAGDTIAWRRRTMNLVSSAGNDGDLGPSSTSSGFSQGVNVIAAGATENGFANSNAPATRRGEDITGFSSRGPKAGFLLAPDLAAPGVVTAAGENTYSFEDGTGSGNGGCGTPTGTTVQGTSFSSPTLGGVALLVQQYFRDGYYPSGEPVTANRFRPTNALVRAVMTNSARNLLGNAGGDRPNNVQGWGAPRLDDTLYFSGDPLRGVDPKGDVDRARLLVLTDTPNGHADVVGNPLSVEPGGQTRADIVQNYRTAINDGDVHDYFVNIVRTDFDGDGNFDDPGNELRITLGWSDVAGAVQPVVNDLDLEVVGPGPNGVLDSIGDTLLGDDVVFRTSPDTVWASGFTVPAADQALQRLVAGSFTDYGDRDPLNPVENVFVPATDVTDGTWRIRVVGFGVRGAVFTNDGFPNFYDNESGIADTRDTDGDTVGDQEEFDRVDGGDQGYALIVSGNFTTTQGLVSLNRSTFGCEGEELVVTLNDENGGADRTRCNPGDGPLDAALTVTIETTTPNRGFPADLEIVEVFSTSGGPPTYQSDPLPIFVTTNRVDVIHGDGVIQVYPDEVLSATYIDGDPCGGQAFAQASVGCRPTVSDSGFAIDDGCDRVDPGNPASTLRADDFMDAGELVRYTVFFGNSGVEMRDARVALTPDPEDPVSQYVHVLNTPQHVGLAPPGRRSDAVFLVQLDDLVCAPVGGPTCDPADPAFAPNGIPIQHVLDFIVEISSPADGLLFPDSFIQTQVLESDILEFRYNTRDPNGELYGFGRIQRAVPGADELSTNPDDFVEYDPMWLDPDAICGGVRCGDRPECINWTRDISPLPPVACNPGRLQNPVNPWDFDDSDEGFIPAAHVDDPLMGSPGLEEWFWRSSPDGGGCGWEQELHDQLSGLPAGHPDKFAQPWGIWHTGAINAVNAGPYAGDATNSQGVPFFEDDDGDRNPRFHSILTAPPDPGATADNSTGQWCQTYISRTDLGSFYRSFLIPPALHRVHQNDPSFRIQFQEMRWYSRLDGHTIDGDNLSIAGWFVSNEPVAPLIVSTPEQYDWNQYQYGTIIFSDDVRSDWTDDDNTLGENLRSLNEDFPDLRYEDFFGPAEDSWNFSLSWGHLNFNGLVSAGQYGFGIDDVEFIWTESKEQPDANDCSIGIGQPATVFFDATRYNACEGDFLLTVVDPSQTETEVVVVVRSAAEDRGEIAILSQTDPATGRYEGVLPFTSDPAFDTDGIVLVSAGEVDIGNGADTVVVEYDPRDTVALAETDPDDVRDWMDVAPADGNNDDNVDNRTGDPIPDGIADAEDDLDGDFERFDASVVNCTSGRLYYIKHRLEQNGPGDNDRFADHGEVQYLALSLLSQIGADLQNVVVTISTEDETVCLINDTVTMDILPTGLVAETAINRATGVGLQFAVPQGVRTTDLADPATVTFRIDVTGIRVDNLNEYSTRGQAFSSPLEQEAHLVLDVDETPTLPNYDDNGPGGRTGRVPGEFREGFESTFQLGPEHLMIPNVSPGVRVTLNDALTDTRYGAADNNGFCPECDQVTECAVPDDCEHRFTPAPNADSYPDISDWHYTDDWAKEVTEQYGFLGRAAAKFGRVAPPSESDQHYSSGQFTSMELPPIYVANTFAPGEKPELRFWHIANFWRPFFTSGLVTPIGAGVLEVSATAAPLVSAQDQANRAGALDAKFPLSTYVRTYPVENTYDYDTDPLNACRTLYCGKHHPVFVIQGDPILRPAAAADPRRGSTQFGTWNEVVVDLSDYRGMQVSIRFTAQVLQDLTVQNGSFGWFVDDIRLLGAATRTALVPQAGNPTSVDPCGLGAAFSSTSADCAGSPVQFFDRHAGVGRIDGTTGRPFPVEYEWLVEGSVLVPRGLEGDVIAGIAGVGGTFDAPRMNLQTALGFGPGRYQVTERLYQEGTVSSEVTQVVIYKDAPVPVAFVDSAGPFIGGDTRFGSTVAFDSTIDADRSFVYEWDFGDGSAIVTSGATPLHRYLAAGSYDVTLTVFDEDGCSGATTFTVVVVPGPIFTAPVATLAGECGTSPPDNHADINEVLTIDVAVTNNGAAATNVVGYLTSADTATEIVGGAASFGPTFPNGATQSATFNFIRREVPGEDLGCIVVPFTLTLVSDGGVVVETLEFGFTLGLASDSAFTDPTTPRTSGGFLGEEAPPITFSPGVDGCINGLEVKLTVTATGTASMRFIEIELETPTFETVNLKYDQTGGSATTWTVDFAFGANDGDAPIRDTNGVVSEGPSSSGLPALTIDSLISQLTGDPMRVAGQVWTLRVRDTHAVPSTAGAFQVTVDLFQLEGTQSGMIEIQGEADCTGCIDAVAPPPVFEGARSSCLDGGRLLWTPADDPTTCDDLTDITYELYVSGTPGVLGSPASIVADCDLDCPTGDCAEARDVEATTWKVCDVESWYWTVVAIDQTTGQRLPDVAAAGDDPGLFQTDLQLTCAAIPGVPIIGLVRGGAALTLHLTNPGVPSLPALRPSANATSHRMLRGTFPAAGSSLRTMGSRPAAYDHASVTCSFTGVAEDVSAEITRAGSFYYLVAGVNSGGCAGLEVPTDLPHPGRTVLDRPAQPGGGPCTACNP